MCLFSVILHSQHSEDEIYMCNNMLPHCLHHHSQLYHFVSSFSINKFIFSYAIVSFMHKRILKKILLSCTEREYVFRFMTFRLNTHDETLKVLKSHLLCCPKKYKNFHFHVCRFFTTPLIFLLYIIFSNVLNDFPLRNGTKWR